MPHHERSRSRSRDRTRRRDSRSRSRSPETRCELPNGAEPISEADYFLKSAEFRVWLKDEKDRYFDELSSEKARSYFRKFVKAWNRGKLSRKLYAGVEPETQSSTAYKWSFASKSTKSDRDALTAVRDDIHSSTYARGSGSSGPSSRKAMGPTMPSSSDLVYAREISAEQATADRKAERKRLRAEGKERVEDMVGPKPLGREGQIEAKRAKREGNRAFQDAKDEGFSAIDDKTLMGGGDGFKDMIAKRDAGKKRMDSRRAERDAELKERVVAIRDKEKNTMEMFQKMAAERFG